MFLGLREVFHSIRDGIRSDNNKSGSFGFARFENIQDGSVEIAERRNAKSSVHEDRESEIDNSNAGSFENPLYSSKAENINRLSQESNNDDQNVPISLDLLALHEHTSAMNSDSENIELKT